MSISIPSQAISSSDPEHAQPSQESPIPSPMEISVQEVAETTFLDLLDEDPYSAIYKTLVPYLSEKDCYNLTLTCKRNYRTVSKIFLLSLLGKKDVDYQSLETWRKRSTLADENVLQAELAPLLVSFGLPLFCTEENKKQTLDRITTILNVLKERDLFTGKEKKHFATLSAKEVFEKPTLLYLLLQTADRCNLVLLFEYMCSLNNKTTFPQKAALVLKLLQDKKDTIQEVIDFYPTNIPNEVCNLTKLTELYLWTAPIKELPESIGNLTQLRAFSLYATQIKEVPERIGKLIQLENLNLSKIEIKKLPEGIGNLTKLKELYLFDTQITILPESIGNLTQLITLNLSSTRITELPEWIGNLTQLKELYFNNTPIKELPKGISNLTQLEQLSLRNTQIKKLPEALSRLPKLVTIYLSIGDTVQLPNSLRGKISRTWH